MSTDVTVPTHGRAWPAATLAVLVGLGGLALLASDDWVMAGYRSEATLQTYRDLRTTPATVVGDERFWLERRPSGVQPASTTVSYVAGQVVQLDDDGRERPFEVLSVVPLPGAAGLALVTLEERQSAGAPRLVRFVVDGVPMTTGQGANKSL